MHGEQQNWLSGGCNSFYPRGERKKRTALEYLENVLSLENGDRVAVEHPEDIAFDPTDNGEGPQSQEFYVISRKVRLFSTFSRGNERGLTGSRGVIQVPSAKVQPLSTFDAVTSVTQIDRGQ